MHQVAVVGAGSWGTALALALSRNGHQVGLWGHNVDHLEQMINEGENSRYLAGFSFPENLSIEPSLQSLVTNHDIFLVATPSRAFRDTIRLLKTYKIQENSTLIWATKGFDQQTGTEETIPILLSEVVHQELGFNVNLAVISGPSFSKEVAANLPTAITAAGSSIDTAGFVAELFSGECMRVYTADDFIGVQVGGAIKNVMAIAAGISDGLGFGANSRSAIITRGLAEISRLGVKMGGDKFTFLGLTGIGDLVLTCTDNQSRNRRFGLGLGQGKTPQAMLSEIGQEVEGYNTSKEVERLARHYSIEMPISQQVFNVLYQGVAPTDAVSSLLARQLISE